MQPIKRCLKRLMMAVAPTATHALLSARARAHSHRLIQEWGLGAINRKLVDHFGATVQTGPFRGMVLSPSSHREHLGPFLLGTYEAELLPWLAALMAREFAQVLDVGAKFGYYAIGFARNMSTTPVLAFDTDWWARAATLEMAVANHTPNVTTAGFCSPRWLDRNLQPRSFLLADCEGYEGELLTNARTPALDTTTLLVELHDQLVPGVGAAIRQRFARTHAIASVCNGAPLVPDVDLSFLTAEEATAATREPRPAQEWLLISPHAAPCTGGLGQPQGPILPI